MSTDFTYGGKQIVSGGPFKPSGEDMPVDARTRVDCYADIASIPNPHVGLKITVKVDETNDNKMTDYIVKSLKANSIGVANSLIDEVVRYVDYLGVNTSGSSGEGLTSEQSQQLTVAYNHSQSTHVSFDDLLNIDAISLNGKKFSEPMTKVEYDAITSKDANTIYLVTDEDSAIEGIPSYSSTEANKVLAVNGNGTALAWIDAPSGSGTGLTSEQANQLATAYNHSQTTHVQASDIPTKVSKLENDSNFTTKTYVDNAISNVEVGGSSGLTIKNIENLISSATNAHPSSFNAKPIRPLVSFVDDDGKAGVYTKWLPLIQSKNIPISICVPTGYVGQSAYMTWEQIKELQDTYNCEILSHTVSHKNIGGFNTNKEWIEELKTSKETLISKGLNVRGFAYPNGGFYGTKEGLVDGTENGHWMTSLFYDYGVITQNNINIHPLKNGNMAIDRAGIGCYQADGFKTLNDLKARIDETVSKNGWLVLMTHVDDANHTEQDTQDISDLIDYIQGLGTIDIVTLSEGFELFGNIIETPNCTITKQGSTTMNVSATVPDATKLTSGIVKIGDGIAVSDGVISVDSSMYYNKNYLDEILDNLQNQINNIGGGGSDSSPIVSSINTISTSPNANFDIVYTAIDSDGIASHELSTDNGTNYSTIRPVSSENNTFTYTTSFSSEGVYYCKLKVTDVLGHNTIKSFAVSVRANNVYLSSLFEQGGSVVDADNGIYKVTNTSGKYDVVFLYDANSNIEVGGDYTLHYELLESTLSDASNLTIGTTWAVTQNNAIFETLVSAEVGTPIDIPFHCYQVPDSKANKLIFIQLGSAGVAGEYIKFKCYVKA